MTSFYAAKLAKLAESVCFSYRRSKHPNHFPKSPKDGWIYLCVIFENQGNTPTVEAIVNADYGSKVSSTAITERLQSVKITRMVIGQEQKKDLDNPNFSPEYSFEGRIADMNVWKWGLDENHVDKLYRGTGRPGDPILKWNTLGFPNKRFGEVDFISITSAFGRGKYVSKRSPSQVLRETL